MGFTAFTVNIDGLRSISQSWSPHTSHSLIYKCLGTKTASWSAMKHPMWRLLKYHTLLLQSMSLLHERKRRSKSTFHPFYSETPEHTLVKKKGFYYQLTKLWAEEELHFLRMAHCWSRSRRRWEWGPSSCVCKEKGTKAAIEGRGATQGGRLGGNSNCREVRIISHWSGEVGLAFQQCPVHIIVAIATCRRRHIRKEKGKMKAEQNNRRADLQRYASLPTSNTY